MTAAKTTKHPFEVSFWITGRNLRSHLFSSAKLFSVKLIRYHGTGEYFKSNKVRCTFGSVIS